ncbi:MAG TPA: SCP2 sterol-binding domain-containing protein, partial [Polyangia bacterium]|nr:SCP2 sterol-binding domain-containing protein [Polyangia bacterium]
MTESWDRPPPDLAPAELFERWLPQAFAAAGLRAPPGAPRLRVSVTGGGAWDLVASGDALTVTAAGRELPEIWVRLSEADLRVALGVADPDLPALVPEHWSMQDLLMIEPADVDLVRQVSGRLAVEIEGRRRRRWVLDVGFGAAGVSAGRPRTTVRLDAATFEGLRSGALAPMQPLLDGRLKIEGDRALAMQLLLLVGSRLS